MLSQLFGGTPGRQEQLPTRTPGQVNIMEQLGQMGLSGLQQGGFDFAPIESQAKERFMQQTIPTIAERFTGMGGRHSSAFRQALGQAGAGLDTNLAAMRGQHGLQQQGQLMQMLGLGLQPQFESLYVPKSPGLGATAAGGIGQGLGMVLPILLSAAAGGMGGGPLGAGASGLTALLSQLNKGGE